MSGVGSDGTFFRNLGLECGECMETFAFVANILDSITRDKFMIVRVWVEGAVGVLLHPPLKDGHFVVGIGEFLLELKDGREFFVRPGSAAVGLSFFWRQVVGPPGMRLDGAAAGIRILVNVS